MLIKGIYIIVGTALAILLSLRVPIVCHIKDNLKVSAFISFLTVLMLLFVVSAFSVVFVTHSFVGKIIMLLIGFSPFIIGKMVSYEKVCFYSIIQIACIVLGISYVLLV